MTDPLLSEQNSSEKFEYDTAKLEAFIKEKWTKANCPMCATNSWLINPVMFQLPEYFRNRTAGPYSSVYPVVPVVCKNCGFSVLVSAIVAGIEAPDKKS